MSLDNYLYNHTEELLKKSNIFIPLLKTIHKLFNNSNCISDDMIKNRIVYIRDVLCKKQLMDVLENEHDIDRHQILTVQNAIDELKYNPNLNTKMSNTVMMKQLNNVTTELQLIVHIIVHQNDDTFHDTFIKFCRLFIPIVYNSRLK